MKKVLIVSATLNSNYILSERLEKILKNINVDVTKISLENFPLPLYTAKNSRLENEKYKMSVKQLTQYFIDNDGIIICAPEYNGSIPPIVNNSIAWISVTTEYWRDAFSNKIGLISTSSGGPGNKFLTSMKIQLEHLGVVVMPRFISVNSSAPLKGASYEDEEEWLQPFEYGR